MLASKIICDDTYSNKSWCIVGQGMFALREINQMEREMCSYLEWQLNVGSLRRCAIFRLDQAGVQLDFAGPGPCPPMVLPQPAPAPFSHQGTGNNINSSTGSSIPAFASRVPLSKDAPVIPSPAIRTYPSSPPDTPEASHSASTSPASSVSPQTPPDARGPGFTVKVMSADSSPVEPPVIPHFVLRPYLIAANPSRFSHSLSAFIYPHQGLRGWLLWYGLALRLAWGATPNRPASEMQAAVGSRPEYANM